MLLCLPYGRGSGGISLAALQAQIAALQSRVDVLEATIEFIALPDVPSFDGNALILVHVDGQEYKMTLDDLKAFVLE